MCGTLLTLRTCLFPACEHADEKQPVPPAPTQVLDPVPLCMQNPFVLTLCPNLGTLGLTPAQ